MPLYNVAFLATFGYSVKVEAESPEAITKEMVEAQIPDTVIIKGAAIDMAVDTADVFLHEFNDLGCIPISAASQE